MRKNEFQHVRSGEPLVIPASTYNAIFDAAQANRNRKINHKPHRDGFDSLFVYVLNDTDKELSRFSVVGLSGPVETNNDNIFCNRVAFKGVVPSKTDRGKYAILQQDARMNQVVRACVYGVTPARIYVEDGKKNVLSCDIKEGVTDYLVSGGTSEVLWSDTSQALRWSYIRIGGTFSVLKGELAQPCAKNDAIVKVKTENEEEIEVAVPYPENLHKCPTGHKCRYYADSDGWMLLNLACPPVQL